MAITTTGSVLTADSTANSGSQSITVPADANFMIVGTSGYADNAAYFSTAGTVTLNGVAATSIAGDGTAAFFMGAMFYLVNPATGTQTFAWDWLGAPAPTDGALIRIRFLKGVDTADAIRDTFGGGQGNGGSYASDTMTAVSGDYLVAWAYQFTDTTTWTWTNATKVADYGFTRAGGGYADASPSGNVQVTATPNSAQDGGLVAVVLKAAAGGGGATVLSPHYYNMMQHWFAAA